VAGMDIAIGVDRTIVQHEQRRALGLPVLADGAVQVLRVPARQNLRLLLRQAAAHGERRVRQEDGFAIVAGRCRAGRRINCGSGGHDRVQRQFEKGEVRKPGAR
jgi:hypothetical protein